MGPIGLKGKIVWRRLKAELESQDKSLFLHVACCAQKCTKRTRDLQGQLPPDEYEVKFFHLQLLLKSSPHCYYFRL